VAGQAGRTGPERASGLHSRVFADRAAVMTGSGQGRKRSAAWRAGRVRLPPGGASVQADDPQDRGADWVKSRGEVVLAEGASGTGQPDVSGRLGVRPGSVGPTGAWQGRESC
jgi:hypothetical protein